MESRRKEGGRALSFSLFLFFFFFFFSSRRGRRFISALKFFDASKIAFEKKARAREFRPFSSSSLSRALSLAFSRHAAANPATAAGRYPRRRRRRDATLVAGRERAAAGIIVVVDRGAARIVVVVDLACGSRCRRSGCGGPARQAGLHGLQDAVSESWCGERAEKERKRGGTQKREERGKRESERTPRSSSPRQQQLLLPSLSLSLTSRFLSLPPPPKKKNKKTKTASASSTRSSASSPPTPGPCGSTPSKRPRRL